MNSAAEAIPLEKSKSIPNEGEKKPNTSFRAIIEVQFCTSCDAHLFTVKHQQAKYLSHFQILKKRFQEINICVRKKAPPSNLYKKSPYCPSNVFYEIGTNKIVYFPEIGSFEVFYQGKKIFSKIQSLKWPTFQAILLQIQNKPSPDDKQSQQKKQAEVQNISKTERPPRVNDISIKQAYDVQSRKTTYRIKGKNQHNLLFRYSIDRRNLFKKPQKNYLTRKSMTARNQNNSQTNNRLDVASHKQKYVNNDQQGLYISPQSHNELTDEMVMKIYRKKDKDGKVHNEIQDKVKNSQNDPSLRKINTKNLGYNVYLQPIFPKTSVNLENYTRNKLMMANKIHEQRKNYEAFKNQAQKEKMFPNNIRINQEINGLFKQRQIKQSKQLRKIKQATEQNDKKDTQHHSQHRREKNSIEPNDSKRQKSKQQNGDIKKEFKKKTIQLITKELKEETHPVESKKQQILQQQKIPSSQQGSLTKKLEKEQKPQLTKNIQLSLKEKQQQQYKKQQLSNQGAPAEINIHNLATSKTIQGQTQKIIPKEGEQKQEENYQEQFQAEEKQKLEQKVQTNKIINKENEKQIKQNEANNLDNYEDQQFDEPDDIEKKQDPKKQEKQEKINPKEKEEKAEKNNLQNQEAKILQAKQLPSKLIEQKKDD